jgi:hypothetical protein
LFSRVVAEGLFTSNPAPDPNFVLSWPVFSEPVHFGCFGEEVECIDFTAEILGAS